MFRLSPSEVAGRCTSGGRAFSADRSEAETQVLSFQPNFYQITTKNDRIRKSGNHLTVYTLMHSMSSRKKMRGIWQRIVWLHYKNIITQRKMNLVTDCFEVLLIL